MSHLPKQLFFSLPPRAPFSLDYFVLHSGVVSAYQQLERLTAAVSGEHPQFGMLCVFGPESCGKTHLLEGFSAQVPEGLRAEKLGRFDFSLGVGPDEDGRFCSVYERLRARGGLLLVESRAHPGEVTENPHVRSRLLAGELVAVSYPSDLELKPLLRSILERRNVRISDKILDYLITRIPRDLLSFDAIFDRIDELSFNESRPLGLGVVRDAVKG